MTTALAPTAAPAAAVGRSWPMDRVARRAHEAALLAELRPEPRPDPEVRCRLARTEEIPRGALSVLRTAEKNGWRVQPTYARGYAMDARGRVGRLTHSLALRMRHPDGRCAVAVWVTPVDGEKTTFDLGYTWRVERFLPLAANVTAIKAFIVWSGNAG